MRAAILVGLASCLAACVSASPTVTGSASPRGSVRELVDQAADAHRIPRRIAHGVIHVESRYRCNARNGVHAGLMQLKPATARSVGVTGNLFDCRTNLVAGMRYLRLALDRGGENCAGVSLYNRGIYARPIRCTDYGRKVLRSAP